MPARSRRSRADPLTDHRAPAARPSPSRPIDVVVLGGEIPVSSDRLRSRRVADVDEMRRAARDLRRGVVVVTTPPATIEDILEIARLRARSAAVRAILVNGADAGQQRLLALGSGFDDAVPDVVGSAEIVGRIELLADRTRGASRDRLAVGDGLELDLHARALRREGRLVRLRPLEFRLLEELARHPGRPVSRAWLLRRVWRKVDLDGSRTVDVHVRWLRTKLEPHPDRPIHLITVRGVGYQLEPTAPAPGA